MNVKTSDITRIKASTNRDDSRSSSGRQVLAIGGIAVAAALFATAPGYAQTPEKPKFLTANVFSGAFEKCFKQSVVPAFMQKTGIEIRTLTSQPSVAKLQAEGADTELDVFIAGESDIKAAYEYGVLAKMDEALLPNLKSNYGSLLQDGVGNGVRYGAVFTVSAQGLIYNADKWPKAPDSWFDLASDKTPGVVNVRVPDNQNTVGWLAVMANSMNGSWPTQVSDYAGVLKQIREKLSPRLGALLPTAGAMQSSFVNDPRSSLTVGFDNVAVAMAERYNMNIKWAAPKEGAYQITTLAAVTRSKNAYWSQAMINTLLDPEVQSEFAECGYYTPSNKNAKISDKVAAKVIHGEAGLEKLLRPKWETIKPIAPELGARFVQAVQAK